MLSSHQAKALSSSLPTSPPSQPFYSNITSDRDAHSGQPLSKALKEEPLDTLPHSLDGSVPGRKSVSSKSSSLSGKSSKSKRPSKMDSSFFSSEASAGSSPHPKVTQLAGTHKYSNDHSPFAFSVSPLSMDNKRGQRKNLLISTDLHDPKEGAQAMGHSHRHSHSHSHSSHLHHHPQSHASTTHRSHSAGPEGDHECIQCNTPPANCKAPNLSRRSSLNNVMTPPPTAGLVRSATTQGLFATTYSESPKQRPVPRRRSTQNIPRRSSTILGPSSQHPPANHLSGMPRMGLSLSVPTGLTDGSYLPTPTDSTFHGSFGGDPQMYPTYPSTGPPLTGMCFPLTPSDPYFPTSVHPFDAQPNSMAIDQWGGAGVGHSGMPPMPATMEMSMASNSAPENAQFLPPYHPSSTYSDAQRYPPLGQQPNQPKNTQARRGSKTSKVKRRASTIPITSEAPPPSQCYVSTNMPWPLMFDQHSSTPPLSVGQPPLANPCYSAQQPANVPIAPAKPYHGPAPCGNPDPLYEYLASPTIVPGLEIIGHDFYGNYVQILPICPETTCTMNQDPMYLNLLQAIYAHTIPFLDLAPGSEEESQLLLNGAPSAIATQSIQPPFRNLLPLNIQGDAHLRQLPQSFSQGNQSVLGTPRTVTSERSASFDEQATLSTLISSPSFQQSFDGPDQNQLLRRASVASISSTTAPSSRRSSIAPIPIAGNNPAKKKKNAPRTHPYKSTSSFKEDNSMVTEAILSEVGGVGGIGNSAHASATDPRRKVAEKMVHMDEAEYAAHYSRHHQAINKSASSNALGLAQTLANSMSGSTLEPLAPKALMSTSISAPSMTNALVTSVGQANGSLAEGIAAADFIRALSECNGGMGEMGLSSGLEAARAEEGSRPVQPAAAQVPVQYDLVSLENLMMLDSTAAAAVQAAAATAWPNWFDLQQLERDVCDIGGEGTQAHGISSASCSLENLSLSNSTTMMSFRDQLSKEMSSTQLLLSSSTDLAMTDDSSCSPLLNNLGDEYLSASAPSDASADTEMTLAEPSSKIKVNHTNSTSQILVFDQFHPSLSSSSSSSTPSSSSIPVLSSSTSFSSCSTSSSSSSSSLAGSGSDAAPAVVATTTTNDLALPYASSLLTVLPFSAQHSHPIFPTRGNRRSGWYRSKSVASQGLSQITGVDYTTTCWYDVEQLQTVVRDSISFQDSNGAMSLEDLTEPTSVETSN